MQDLELNDSANTNRTLFNIRKTLAKGLKEKYKSDNKADEILDTHGLTPEHFDFIYQINRRCEAELNDISIDDSANRGEKTIESIHQETLAPVKKAIGFDYLYRQMRALYGKEEAGRLSAELYDYSLALADSTSILKPYCYAVDASKLNIIGRDWGRLRSSPTKYITSYIATLCETVHELASHLAGAIAIGSFFLDIGHLLIYKEKISFNKLKNKKFKKKLQNEFQRLVHSIAHRSRNSIESPFSNLSVFDRVKLKNLIKSMNWYFPPEEFVDKKYQDTKDCWEDFVVEYIMEIQKIFIDFFDKGDPLSNGMPYSFPVVTINFTKENRKILDQKLLKYITSKDSSRYNLYVSATNKVASCCVEYNQKIWVKFKDTNSVVCMSIGALIDNYPDRSFKVMNSCMEWSECKKVKIPYKDDMYVIKISDDTIDDMCVTPDHIFPTPIPYKNRFIDKQARDLKVGDQLICATPDYDIKIKGIDIRKNTGDYVYCFEMEDQSEPYFMLENGIVTHNCRLLSDTEMMELAGESNSFGGVGISLGSHRVVTINFNRIALEALQSDKPFLEFFFERLGQRIEDTAKILKAHKELIINTKNMGLQLFIDNGWINMSRMFSTFGMMGLVEANETFKKVFVKKEGIGTGDYNFIEDVLKYFNDIVAEVSKKYKIIGNIEQIPGESMAVRLCKIDKMLFGEDKVPYKLYSNQFVPLWEDATLWERLEVDGKYNKLVTGGGIVHAQIGEKVTQRQAIKIIEHAVKCGCEHFALNAVYSKCSENHTSFGKKTVCPVCGSQEIEYFTRVVGFFTQVSKWNPTRREEFKRRTFVD